MFNYPDSFINKFIIIIMIFAWSIILMVLVHFCIFAWSIILMVLVICLHFLYFVCNVELCAVGPTCFLCFCSKLLLNASCLCGLVILVVMHHRFNSPTVLFIFLGKSAEIAWPIFSLLLNLLLHPITKQACVYFCYRAASYEHQ